MSPSRYRCWSLVRDAAPSKGLAVASMECYRNLGTQTVRRSRVWTRFEAAARSGGSSSGPDASALKKGIMCAGLSGHGLDASELRWWRQSVVSVLSAVASFLRPPDQRSYWLQRSAAAGFASPPLLALGASRPTPAHAQRAPHASVRPAHRPEAPRLGSSRPRSDRTCARRHRGPRGAHGPWGVGGAA